MNRSLTCSVRSYLRLAALLACLALSLPAAADDRPDLLAPPPLLGEITRLLREGRLPLAPREQRIVLHDPCYLGRHNGELGAPRSVLAAATGRAPAECELNREKALCCGAGGGAWAMPYDQERLAYGKVKADQIKNTGAEIVVAPCHNCRDQIMKGLPGKFDMGNYHETLYIWELVANSLIYEPWSEEEIKKSHAARDAQFERDGIDLEDMAW